MAGQMPVVVVHAQKGGTLPPPSLELSLIDTNPPTGDTQHREYGAIPLKAKPRPEGGLGVSSFLVHLRASESPYILRTPQKGPIQLPFLLIFNFCLSITARFDNKNTRSCLASKRSDFGRGACGTGPRPNLRTREKKINSTWEGKK